AGLAVLLLVGGFFGYKYLSPTKQIESIAVMPFVNTNGNEDVEYLSDGMTETLIKSLSQIPNLNVKPRSSVFRYKGKDSDLQTIAKELNVQAILNGRVVQRGDELTLSLELVDVQKDSVIWTEQYQRKQSDLLALQSEIANDVLNNLKAKLSVAEVAKLSKSYTTDPEAYQLYLKGRYHWNKRTSDDLEKAVINFKSAIEKDDRFALAYSGLADAYSVLQYYQGSRSAEFINKATPYAVRAEELDDQLAEAHSSLAFVNEGSWKWAEAEREYLRALELNPNYSSALLRYARFEVRVPKRDAEGLARIKRAVEIEPSSAVISDNLSQMYLSQGKVDLALDQATKTVELDPNFSFGWIDLAYAQLKKGQTAEALTSAEKVAEITKRSSRSLICLGFVYAATGRRDEAKAILKELEQRYSGRQADAVDVAALHAGLEDKEQVFVWLDKAFADHSSLLVDLRAEYPFAGLLDDPRMENLRKRMNLPE
ncbi:MAG: tetratricopeptide repeat protein, partial [Pyrinomonadaceae bacterium]